MTKLEPSTGELFVPPAATPRQNERREAAYQAAWREIDALEPGETIQYHEGYLAADSPGDPEVAGRGAAFRQAAIECAKGTLAQRRIGFEWYQYVFRRCGS